MTGPVRIELYTGPRNALRRLFELAEDSPAELDSYLEAGRVLVAVSGQEVIGHLQLVDTDRAGQLELKNMAILEAAQGRGIGTRLVEAALDLAAAGRRRRPAGPRPAVMVLGEPVGEPNGSGYSAAHAERSWLTRARSSARPPSVRTASPSPSSRCIARALLPVLHQARLAALAAYVEGRD